MKPGPGDACLRERRPAPRRQARDDRLRHHARRLARRLRDRQRDVRREVAVLGALGALDRDVAGDRGDDPVARQLAQRLDEQIAHGLPGAGRRLHVVHLHVVSTHTRPASSCCTAFGDLRGRWSLDRKQAAAAHVVLVDRQEPLASDRAVGWPNGLTRTIWPRVGRPPALDPAAADRPRRSTAPPSSRSSQRCSNQSGRASAAQAPTPPPWSGCSRTAAGSPRERRSGSWRWSTARDRCWRAGTRSACCGSARACAAGAIVACGRIGVVRPIAVQIGPPM